MDTRRFHKLLYEATVRLLPREAAVVCAVSGGCDSIALLHGLFRMNQLRKCGLHLCVAHLDHHLPPGSSAQMAEFTHRNAAGLGLPFYEERIDVPARSASTGESFEEAGRKARYEFFERAADQFNAKFVAVAHQADDQAETVLHRILRGTSLKGLAGMSESRRLRPDREIRIVRPMLSLRRSDVTDYLHRRDIPFMHDPTNDDTAVATRNVLRHALLPEIRRLINPNVDGALTRLAAHARHAADFVSETAAGLFDAAAACADCDAITLRAAALSDASAAVLGEVVLIALRRCGAGLKAVSAERIEAVTRAVRPEIAHRIVELPDRMIAERRGKYLFIKRRRPEARPDATIDTPEVHPVR
ncbi:MAG: tRNA lysidine(34) synthetase TilS [Phycisphaerae bacterium]|nr:tRNA lysidine(34) synthetase TilS [Phycisphaerae bacterium]